MHSRARGYTWICGRMAGRWNSFSGIRRATRSTYPVRNLWSVLSAGTNRAIPEGSGLGISIAKSLMELMGGSFMLYVDGDLFKVVLGFAQMEEEKEPLDEDKSGK